MGVERDGERTMEECEIADEILMRFTVCHLPFGGFSDGLWYCGDGLREKRLVADSVFQCKTDTRNLDNEYYPRASYITLHLRDRIAHITKLPQACLVIIYALLSRPEPSKTHLFLSSTPTTHIPPITSPTHIYPRVHPLRIWPRQHIVSPLPTHAPNPPLTNHKWQQVCLPTRPRCPAQSPLHLPSCFTSPSPHLPSSSAAPHVPSSSPSPNSSAQTQENLTRHREPGAGRRGTWWRGRRRCGKRGWAANRFRSVRSR
jgi:hypothetical protein